LVTGEVKGQVSLSVSTPVLLRVNPNQVSLEVALPEHNRYHRATVLIPMCRHVFRHSLLPTQFAQPGPTCHVKSSKPEQ